MVKPRFLAVLLVTALFALSFSQGLVEARKVQVMRQAAARHYGRQLLPEEMAATVMDYNDPTANTNTHGGSGMLPPQDPSSPPRH